MRREGVRERGVEEGEGGERADQTFRLASRKIDFKRKNRDVFDLLVKLPMLISLF